MRPLLVCLLIAISCTVCTNGFLFKKKFVDGCNPNNCKNKATCATVGTEKKLYTCTCPTDENGVDKYYGLKCEDETGCYNKPCKNGGKCKNDVIDRSKYQCTCDNAYVGPKCDIKNKCLDPKTCGTHGTCKLDSKFKPVCGCSHGFKGKSCSDRNCTIVKTKGKYLISKLKIYLDGDKVTQYNVGKLDDYLKLCGCKLNVTQSFTKLVNPTDMVRNNDRAFVIGRGFRAEVMDKDGKKVICDKKCLEASVHKDGPTACLLKGLNAIKWRMSRYNPGVFETNFDSYNLKEYNELQKYKQIGCSQDKHFETFKGRDHLLVDYNPNSANKCPHGLAGPDCKKDDLCVKKNPCKSGSTCTLDAKLKPVCSCKIGFGGSKCDKKNCTIAQFKGGNGFGGHWYKHTKFYVSEDKKKDFEALEKLAEKCKVQIKVSKAFSKNIDPNYKIDHKAALYVGYGVEATLNDKSGKLLCNSVCLGKNTQSMTGMEPVKCFLSALGSKGWAHSTKYPTMFYIKSLMLKTGAEYKKLKELKQVGCGEEKWYKEL
jgi:hypothetical protein